MTLADFDYVLPEHLIAKEPVEPRDSSRLLVAERSTGALRHHRFRDLPTLLRPGDCLVFNDSAVFPARLNGHPEGSTAAVEALLVRRLGTDLFEAMVRPGRRFAPGKHFTFPGGLRAEVTAIHPVGTRSLRFNREGGQLDTAIDAHGEIPLPPYLRGSQARPDQYQTVYARHRGSCAAPTAGLHFTPELIGALAAAGIAAAQVTLHVGPGTFLPVKEEDPRNHLMHQEAYELTEETADHLNRIRESGGRIIAVGTTAVRVLESCSDESGTLHPGTGDTRIFIYPGYRWKVVDGLITNFHLPRSTLMMLVASFAGQALTRRIYDTAIAESYRFYSFGDASLLL